MSEQRLQQASSWTRRRDEKERRMRDAVDERPRTSYRQDS